VAALTQANSRLAKQLEDNSTELRELKALIKMKSVAKEASTPHPETTVVLMATKLVALTRASLANS
jgi:hypothetical protein